MDGLVSIIITTFKTSDSLKRAIDSVLKQTYKLFEVIVVDDNNPDTDGRKKAELIMSEYVSNTQVVYLKHKKNRNGSAARNTGIRSSKGEFIVFLDDDDCFHPERLMRCVYTLNQHPEFSAVYTGVELVYCKKTVLHEVIYSGEIWKPLLLDESLLGTGSNLFLRRESVLKVGGFDESYIRYQDIEFMLRVAFTEKVYAINEPLVYKYIYERNSPNYQKYKNVREKVFIEFKYLIERLSQEEKEYYFIKNYKTLLSLALASGEKNEISQAARDLKKYRKLTLKERFNVRFPFVWRLINKS